MPGDGRPAEGHRRGFVFGELLIAFLLLAVAVSSLAALMYSVSRRPVAGADAECVASAAAAGKCVPVKPVTAAAPSKLLRSGCQTRAVFDRRPCKDTLVSSDTGGEAVIKARTDSAAVALMAKKQKSERERERTDLGFIR